jgi:aminoglycoside 6'-N-acetyltransferase I
MTSDVRVLEARERSVLDRLADGLFDEPLQADLVREFLADARHHLMVATSAGVVVGFVSSVDYVHPDKPRELWINEVSVAPEHQGHGVGNALLRATLNLARTLGCSEAWVLTDRSNERAMRLYLSAGGTASDQVMVSFPLGKREGAGT